MHAPLLYINALPMKIKEPHWHLPRGTEANHECLLKISDAGMRLKLGPPEYKEGMQTTRAHCLVRLRE